MSISKENFDKLANDVWNDVTKDNKWVTYPEINPTIDDLKNHTNMSENNRGVIFTPKLEEEGRIDELPVTDESPILTQEEIEKFSPKENEGINEGVNEGINEGVNEGINEGVNEEPKELTEEEKREIFITALKQSKIKFRPIKNLIATVEEKIVDRKFGGKRKERIRKTLTNVTINPYGTAYKQERKRKNKMQKKSRKLARKG